MGLTADAFLHVPHRKREIIKEKILSHKRLQNDGIFAADNRALLEGIIL